MNKIEAISELPQKYFPQKNSIKHLNELSFKKGISYERIDPKIKLFNRDLQDLYFSNFEIIQTTRKYMNEVRYIDDYVNALFYLVDKNGYVLDVAINRHQRRNCSELSIDYGACMDYFSFGTNAISIAKYELKSIVLYGFENYCKGLKHLHSYAKPIFTNNSANVFLVTFIKNINQLPSCIGLVNSLCELISKKHQCYLEKQSSSISKEDKIEFYGNLMVKTEGMLTLREIEVLFYLYNNYTYTKILRELSISKNTLKTHIRNIYQKMDVNKLDECMIKVYKILHTNNSLN